jgi:hypothetical protein
MDEPRESRGVRQALAYAFVSVLLVLVIVMLAITPNPAWMEGAPNESAVGVSHPLAQFAQSNSTENSKAKQLQLASVPLNPGQIRAIMSVRVLHQIHVARKLSSAALRAFSLGGNSSHGLLDKFQSLRRST